MTKAALLTALFTLIAFKALAEPMPVYKTDNSPQETILWQEAHMEWGLLTESQQKSCLEVPPGGAQPTTYLMLLMCVNGLAGDNALKRLKSQ